MFLGFVLASVSVSVLALVLALVLVLVLVAVTTLDLPCQTQHDDQRAQKTKNCGRQVLALRIAPCSHMPPCSRMPPALIHLKTRPTNDGYLFLTSGLPLKVAAGAVVELGGRKWATRQLPDGALELSIVTASDDGRQRVAQRMDATAHEQKQRQAEVEALKLQQTQLMADMEEVLCAAAPSLPHLAFSFHSPSRPLVSPSSPPVLTFGQASMLVCCVER